MLIRNEISLKYIVSFNLTFDDPELNKNIDISVGDVVRIAYADMKNRINKRIEGKVSEIKTDRVKNNNLISNINDSIELYNDEVILKIDGSTEYNSNIVSIMGRDILDIDKYPFEEGKDPSEGEGKDPSESEGTGTEGKDPSESEGTGEEVKDPSKGTGEEGKDPSTTTEENNSEIDKNNQSSSEETEKENVDTSTEIKDNENNKANTDSIVESSNNTTEEADNTITE